MPWAEKSNESWRSVRMVHVFGLFSASNAQRRTPSALRQGDRKRTPPLRTEEEQCVWKHLPSPRKRLVAPRGAGTSTSVEPPPYEMALLAASLGKPSKKSLQVVMARYPYVGCLRAPSQLAHHSSAELSWFCSHSPHPRLPPSEMSHRGERGRGTHLAETN